MAETFDIVSAIPTQRLAPGGRLEDVIEATGITKPHEVMFSVTVPKTAGWIKALEAAAREEAAELEAAFAL